MRKITTLVLTALFAQSGFGQVPAQINALSPTDILLVHSSQSLPILDTTFSDDGVLTTSIWNNNFTRCVAVQPDRKILVGGNMSRTNPSNQSYFIGRYNEDGTLDSSFGTDGFLYQANNNGAWIMDMAVQNDGKILIAGRWGTATFVGRLLAEGTFDTSFGTDGLSIFGESSGYVKQMELLSDGSILVVGSVGFTNNLDAFLAKFTSDGELDAAFGNNGLMITDFGYPTLITNSFVMLPDGKIILGGAAVPSPSAPSQNQLLLARFNADGSLDTSYGDNGLVLHASVTGEARAIAIDSQQRVVAVGEKDIVYAGTGTAGHSVILRFNSDGSHDTTFNQTGHNMVNVHSYAEYASAILIDEDDNAYFTGHYFGGTGNIFRRFVARFTDSGAFDETFGTGGIYLSPQANYTGESALGSNNMVLTDNGRLVIGGFINAYLSNNITLMRLIVDDSALSTNTAASHPFTLYPNPAQNELHIASDQRVESVEIFNVSGQLVGQSEGRSQVNVANLSAGVYFLQVHFADGARKTSKFIKQ